MSGGLRDRFRLGGGKTVSVRKDLARVWRGVTEGWLMVVSGIFLAGVQRQVLGVKLGQYQGIRHSLLEDTGLTDTKHQDITFCY